MINLLAVTRLSIAYLDFFQRGIVSFCRCCLNRTHAVILSDQAQACRDEFDARASNSSGHARRISG